MRPSTVLAASVLLWSPVLVHSGPASAQEVECHDNDVFRVAVESFDDEPGSRFAVTALKGSTGDAACRFDPASADRVIGRKGDPLWFGELAGRHLILTRSTGPQGDLVIYDLETGKSVLDVPADDYTVEPGRLVFWQRMEEANAGNCPDLAAHEADGLGSVIVEQHAFDLASDAAKSLGQRRCEATQ